MMELLRFNTTLVTVYPCKHRRQRCCNNVSIQLLLLFIGNRPLADQVSIKFQYNSCYCLSRCRRLLQLAVRVSIQLLLLFIASEPVVIMQDFQVSIQLLLLFIAINELNTTGQVCFNTTLVTVYLIWQLLLRAAMIVSIQLSL